MFALFPVVSLLLLSCLLICDVTACRHVETPHFIAVCLQIDAMLGGVCCKWNWGAGYWAFFGRILARSCQVFLKYI